MRYISVELVLALNTLKAMYLEGLLSNLIVKKQLGIPTKTTSTKKLLKSIKNHYNAMKLLK